MKKLILALTMISFHNALAVDTVDSLDVNQYMGFWHQVGAIPQRFAEDCARNQSADYRELEDGTIEVLNSCEEADGTVTVAEGRARVNADFNDPARLEVTFAKVFGNYIWAFAGDYWVIDLDTNYQWSLVGHPELSGLYILSREPKLDRGILKQMRETIQTMGYDSCDVVMTATPGGVFEGGERFCDLKL